MKKIKDISDFFEYPETYANNSYKFIFLLVFIKPILYIAQLLGVIIIFSWIFSGFGLFFIIAALDVKYYWLVILITIIDLVILFNYIKFKLNEYKNE